MNRKYQIKHSMRLLLYSSILLFITLIFTGCSDMVEIEDRNFVQAVGIAIENNELKVSYGLPDISVLTGQQAQKGDKLYVSYAGKNLSDIEEQYAYNSDKKLDYNHLKAIIFEYTAIKNPEYMRNVLLYIEENYDIARNTKAFITTSRIEDVLKLDETMSGSVGDYLESYYNNNRSKQFTEECTIGDLINALNNGDQVVHVPVLTIQNKRFRIDGVGLFDGKKCECNEFLNEEESKYLYLAEGKVKETNLSISKGYEVRINDLDTQYTYSLKDNRPYIYLEIEGEATLADYDTNVTNQSVNSKNVDKTQIEQEINNQIKSQITNYYNLYVKQKGIDFINLYRRSGVKSRKIWMLYNNKLDDFLKDVDIGVVVNMELDHDLMD